MILLDTGPIVAYLHAQDDLHQEAVGVLKSIREPLGTVWPVVTEAMHLLGFDWRAQDAVFELLARGAPRLLTLEEGDLGRMRDLMAKYRDLPMDLADAALVRVAERERIRKVLTFDRGDFSAYRPDRIGRFTILP